MYIVKFQGGLGNQMFQYAFMQLLKKRYPAEEVVADLSNYALHNPHTGYQLKSIFGIDLPLIAAKQLENITGMYVPEKHCAVLPALDRKINKFIYRIKNKNKTPKNMIMQAYTTGYPVLDSSLLGDGDVYLNGTWMNENFGDILDDLRKIYTLPVLSCAYSEYLKEKIMQDNASNLTVSVHIRGGDYLGTELQIIGVSYYREAFERICEERDDAVFYLFADDQELAQKYADMFQKLGMRRQQIVFVEDNPNKKDVDDLFLMSYCKYNIIANSTFSYWAALLNNNSGHKLFYPSLYAKEKEFWNMDWIPFENIKIKV